MINSGSLNTLTMARATENGLYLTDNEGNEVLLPNRYVPDSYDIGDAMEVFVYHDSEDRMVATTETPRLMVGEVAVLEVVGTTRFGAFLDWGLPKDLFVPIPNQLDPMRSGDKHAVTVYVDNASGRLVGTAKIARLINNENITVKPRQEVRIVIARRRERGFRVIIDGKHWGMLYDDQIFSDMGLGDTATAFVRKISDDGRIDVSLQKQGFDQVKVAADAILELLGENGGKLDVGDDSTPDEVRLTVGMSKKVFKRAVGFLMRAGVVTAGAHIVELVVKD